MKFRKHPTNRLSQLRILDQRVCEIIGVYHLRSQTIGIQFCSCKVFNNASSAAHLGGFGYGSFFDKDPYWIHIYWVIDLDPNWEHGFRSEPRCTKKVCTKPVFIFKCWLRNPGSQIPQFRWILGFEPWAIALFALAARFCNLEILGWEIIVGPFRIYQRTCLVTVPETHGRYYFGKF